MRLFAINHPMATFGPRWFHVACAEYEPGKDQRTVVTSISHSASGPASQYSFKPSETWFNEPNEWDVLCLAAPFSASLLPGVSIGDMTINSSRAVDYWSTVVIRAIEKFLDDEEHEMEMAMRSNLPEGALETPQ